MSDITYNRVIRKLVVGFGSLFDKITLVRYNTDRSEQQRVLVPLAYATKELYVRRLEDDPDLQKKIQIALPRMSFEMNGLTYDVSRKQNTNIKQFTRTAEGVISQYNPVPYNFDFSLYIYVRNMEDGTQIIEHILPYFTPDYTIKLNLIPEMGIVKEVPVILNNASHEIVYEGDKNSETRMIIWTLNFTVKGFIFGKISDTGGLIKHSITNILDGIKFTDIIQMNMTSSGIGQYKIGELVYQGFSYQSATASAVVESWNGAVLKLKNIQGNFVSDKLIIGAESDAKYSFTNYQIMPSTLARIDIKPDPLTANGNNDFDYDIRINERDEIEPVGDMHVQFGTEELQDDLSLENTNLDLQQRY
jgi:hypothetical protein